MISVIVPVFNKADYVQRTIRSVINQDYSDWEVIIVDDGSTDKSILQIEMELKKHSAEIQKRFTLLSQSNEGQASARYKGFVASRGEFVALLDADDFWEPSKLRQQMHFLDCHPTVDVLLTNYCVFYETDSLNHSLRIRPVSLPGVEKLVTDWATTVGDGGLVESTGLFRRTFLQTVLNKNGPSMAGGLEICIKAHLAGKLGLLSLCLCGYVQTNSGWHKNKEDLIASYKYLLKQNYISESFGNKMISGLDSHLAYWRIRNSSTLDASFFLNTAKTLLSWRHFIYALKTFRRVYISGLARQNNNEHLENLKAIWDS